MTLKKVTPKALKTLKELGLLDNEISQGASYEIYLDKEKLSKLWDVCFVEPMPEYELIDLGEFTQGYTDFFGQLIPKFKG